MLIMISMNKNLHLEKKATIQCLFTRQVLQSMACAILLKMYKRKYTSLEQIQ